MTNEKNIPAFYPFLAIIFPILALVSAHHSELIWKEVLIALSATVAVLLIAWGVLRFILTDPHKRGLVLFILAFAFWTVAPSLDWLRDHLQIGQLLSRMVVATVIILVALLFVALLRLITQGTRSFRLLTVSLNTILLAITAVSLLSTTYSVLSTTSYSGDSPSESQTNVTAPENAPDIIHIVADMYGRQDMLEKYFGLDNTPFINALRERGFYVADESFANYNFTDSSVASVLNYQFLDGLSPDHGGDIPYATLISENRIAANLRARGYEFISYASGMGFSEIRAADQYRAPPSAISEFGNLLITRTPARFVINRLRALGKDSAKQGDLQYDQHRDRILFAFEGLRTFEKKDRPQFLFAHILLPHDPFVLDADLNPLIPETRYYMAAYPHWAYPDIEEYMNGFRNHVHAFNKLMLEAIDAIQSRHPDTVILLHGDHGPHSNMAVEYNGNGWEPYIDEEMAMLNALYLPGVDTESVLYPSISPVNQYRVVLNEYFDEDLPLLEDRSYYVRMNEEEILDITDRISALPKPSTP